MVVRLVSMFTTYLTHGHRQIDRKEETALHNRHLTIFLGVCLLFVPIQLFINCGSFVFLLHVLYAIFLRRLGMKTSTSVPSWIERAMWFCLGFCPSVGTLGSKLLDLLQKYTLIQWMKERLGMINCGIIKSIKLWIKCYPFKYHVSSCHELKPSSGSWYGWYCKTGQSWKEKVLIFEQNLKSLLHLPWNWKLIPGYSST